MPPRKHYADPDHDKGTRCHGCTKFDALGQSRRLLSVNRLHPKLGCDGGCDLVAQAQQEK